MTSSFSILPGVDPTATPITLEPISASGHQTLIYKQQVAQKAHLLKLASRPSSIEAIAL